MRLWWKIKNVRCCCFKDFTTAVNLTEKLQLCRTGFAVSCRNFQLNGSAVRSWHKVMFMKSNYNALEAKHKTKLQSKIIPCIKVFASDEKEKWEKFPCRVTVKSWAKCKTAARQTRMRKFSLHYKFFMCFALFYVNDEYKTQIFAFKIDYLEKLHAKTQWERTARA